MTNFDVNSTPPPHSVQRLQSLTPSVDNGSMPTPVVGRLPGPVGDHLWLNLKNFETLAMVLVGEEFPLSWFLTTTLLSTPQMQLSSINTGTGAMLRSVIFLGR